MVYLLIVVAAVILIATIAYGTQRKSRDGVASFKRQIDALSPEARKPVVDQVQSVSDLRRSSDTPKPDPDTLDPDTTDPGNTDAVVSDPGSSDDVKAAHPADDPGDSVDGS